MTGKRNWYGWRTPIWRLRCAWRGFEWKLGDLEIQISILHSSVLGRGPLAAPVGSLPGGLRTMPTRSLRFVARLSSASTGSTRRPPTERAIPRKSSLARSKTGAGRGLMSSQNAFCAGMKREKSARSSIPRSAAAYGTGHSEEVVARALKDWRRSRPYVFTKCVLRWDEKGKISKVFNPEIGGRLRNGPFRGSRRSRAQRLAQVAALCLHKMRFALG